MLRMLTSIMLIASAAVAAPAALEAARALLNADSNAPAISIPARVSPADDYWPPDATPDLGLGAMPSVSIVARDAQRDAAIAAARDDAAARKVRVVSAHVDVPRIREGDWRIETLPDGRTRRRMTIASPGATFLRPHVTAWPGGNFDVHVRGTDGMVRRLAPTATAATSDFWGPAVSGDAIEIVVDGAGAAPAIAIDRLAHGLVWPGAGLELGCYLDVTCYDDWKDARTGVAEIYIESTWGGYSCTGSLLSDTAGSLRPWFLTANHCLSTVAEADSVIVFWNFHTAACNGAPPNHETLPTSSGSEIAAKNGQSDFTLLLLDENPPPGTTYLGVSTAPLLPGAPITVVHHPDAAYKRITFGNVTGVGGDFWTVLYTESSTEGGSSGSPLFNASKQVVGQLWGGEALCTRMWGTDDFGKISSSWNLGLGDALDSPAPTTTTTTTLPGTTTTTTHAPSDDDDDFDDDDFDDDSALGNDDAADDDAALDDDDGGDPDGLDSNYEKSPEDAGDSAGGCGC
ncbi:serine protease [bacterium]|nr:serine protease [bacterium]